MMQSKLITVAIILLQYLMGNSSSVMAQSVNAVVLEETNSINIYNGNGYTWTSHREVLIKSPMAKKQMQFGLFQNDDTSLSKFQITLSDTNGKILRTIKQKDLQRTELSSGLATDGYFYFAEFTANIYPIVATLDFKVDYKRNNLSFPPFDPMDDYDTEVSHATYSISSPKGSEVDYHCVNCDIRPVVQQEAEATTLTFEMKNMQGVRNSSYNRPLSLMAPKIYLKPRKANYYNTSCDLSSWNAMGKWVYSLWDGRDELPPEAIAKVKSLTQDYGDGDITKKAAALYKYLAQTTRYVSIQLGLGGYQPMKASDVWKLGYGDCKALSNYMKALLKAAGVESCCVSISTTEDKLLPDFPNFQQMDHAILEVPTGNDTLWIECTNPQLPLGYVPYYLSGHEGLEIRPEGGKIVTLPDYPDASNERISNVSITLSDDGSADMILKETFTNHQYYVKSHLAKSDEKELRETLLRKYLIPQAVTSAVKAEDESEPYGTPTITTLFEGKSNSYANISGSRLFVPSTPLHKDFSPGNDSHVSEELYIKTGFRALETVTIGLPEGYELESVPAAVQCKSPFANFTVDVNKGDKQVTITTTIEYCRGLYPNSAQELNDMEKKMAAAFNKKLVLKRTQ